MSEVDPSTQDQLHRYEFLIEEFGRIREQLLKLPPGPRRDRMLAVNDESAAAISRAREVLRSSIKKTSH